MERLTSFIQELNESLAEKYVDCDYNMNLMQDEAGIEAGCVYDEYKNKRFAYIDAMKIVEALAKKYKCCDTKEEKMYCTDCSQEQFLKCGEIGVGELRPCQKPFK